MLHAAFPHDFHPDLTPERLSRLEQIGRDKRAQAFEAHKELAKTQELYWSTCCLAFELTMNAFEALADEVPWLTFHREQRHAYVIAVGEVPIRVQRSDHAPKRVMDTERSLANATQTRLPFRDGNDTLADYMVRLEFAVAGSLVSICDLSVRNKKGDVLYNRWLVGTPGGAVVATPIVREAAQDVPAADFDLYGEEGANAEPDLG